MDLGFSLIETNLEMTKSVLVMLIFGFGGLLFFAKGFKEGLVGNFLMFALIFAGFYAGKSYGWEWSQPLIALFVYLALMAISLLPSYTVKTGGII